MKKNVWQMLRSFLFLAKKFGIGQWSFIGPGSEKKWYSMEENSPQGIWDHIAEKMLVEFAESRCHIFRGTTPLSRCKLKSKGHGKLSIHYRADQATIETICRIIVSANQLSVHGAVANMCEECESLHDRSGQPDMVMGQSIVLSEIKTEVPLDNDDPAYQNFLLQRYEERIERLSQTDERNWIDVEPAEPSLAAYEVSKKVIHLLRHSQKVQREDDGAVQFWRIKFYLRNQFP